MVPEQLLRSVINSLDAGLCVIALDGTVVGTNRVWDEMLDGAGGCGADGPGSFFALSQQGPAELGALLQEAAVAVRDLAAGREPAAGQTHRLLAPGAQR